VGIVRWLISGIKYFLQGYGAGNYNKLQIHAKSTSKIVGKMSGQSLSTKEAHTFSEPFCGRSFIEFWDEMMHTVHISRQASYVELDNIQGTARGRRFVSQKPTSKHASIVST
jgi:hypothetical protein